MFFFLMSPQKQTQQEFDIKSKRIARVELFEIIAGNTSSTHS